MRNDESCRQRPRVLSSSKRPPVQHNDDDIIETTEPTPGETQHDSNISSSELSSDEDDDVVEVTALPPAKTQVKSKVTKSNRNQKVFNAEVLSHALSDL